MSSNRWVRDQEAKSTCSWPTEEGPSSPIRRLPFRHRGPCGIPTNQGQQVRNRPQFREVVQVSDESCYVQCRSVSATCVRPAWNDAVGVGAVDAEEVLQKHRRRRDSVQMNFHLKKRKKKEKKWSGKWLIMINYDLWRWARHPVSNPRAGISHHPGEIASGTERSADLRHIVFGRKSLVWTHVLMLLHVTSIS